MRVQDETTKKKMKEYADRKALASDVAVGDVVLAKQKKQNKFSTPFDPQQYKVVAW